VNLQKISGLLGVAAVVVVADQLTKLLVQQQLDLYQSVPVIPHFFNLTRVHNTGAAFGMLDGAGLPYQSAVLTTIRLAALAGLTWFAATLPPTHRLARGGLALVVGGAAGNLVDGLLLGHVVDFLDFYWGGWHFWSFNVADAAITVGMAFVILDQIGIGQQRVPGTV
jgi:signal peptidase II